MEFTGEFTVAAPPERIWTILTDTNELEHCVPGAQEVTRVDESTYSGTIVRSVAGLSLRLSGEVEVIEEQPNEYMAATVTAGDNRAGSWTKVTADGFLTITADGDQTTLEYRVTADVSGRVASLGSQLVEPKVRSDIESFFDAVERRASDLDVPDPE